MLERIARRLNPHLDVNPTRPFSIDQAFGYSYRRYGRMNDTVLSLPMKRIPGIDAWLVARVHAPFPVVSSEPADASHVHSFDLLFLRSVAQVFDGYAGVGSDDPGHTLPDRPAFEAGTRIGIPVPAGGQWIPPFIGIRAGLRAARYEGAFHLRVTGQITLGVW